MIFEIGRYIINFGAIVAIEFHEPSKMNVSGVIDFKPEPERATVYLTGPAQLELNEAEIAAMRGAFAAIADSQQSQIAVPVPPNLRGARH